LELEAVVSTACESLGIELFDLEYRAGIVSVTVERAGGLDLDAVAEVSRAISAALDEADPVPDAHYELEVSTPGVERRLRRPEHFAAAIGERLAVRTKPGVPGDRRFEGRLAKAGPDEVLVETDAGERKLAYDQIERAHTVFDWRAALAAPRGDADGGDDEDANDREDGRTTSGPANTRERAGTS
jgi:ribosome maturation factor RimP